MSTNLICSFCLSDIDYDNDQLLFFNNNNINCSCTNQIIHYNCYNEWIRIQHNHKLKCPICINDIQLNKISSNFIININDDMIINHKINENEINENEINENENEINENEINDNEINDNEINDNEINENNNEYINSLLVNIISIIFFLFIFFIIYNLFIY